MDLGAIFRTLVTLRARFESSLGAVARIRQLVLDMPPEENRDIDPPKFWPTEGKVVIRNVHGGYAYVLSSFL